MRKNMMWRLVVLMLVAALANTACGAITGGGTPSSSGPPAASLLPTLTGYNVVEGQSVQEFIAGLGEAASALLGQFQATAAIELIDRVAGCYQDIGAVALRLYSQQEYPVIAGGVAVANRDLLTDPQTFLYCVGLAPQPSGLSEGQGGGGLQPCFYNYSIEIQGDTYDIFYVGTDVQICQAFCAGLQGCTGH
ncbi:MAG: hypothetical protein JW910_03165 [Anaerolineae bacterium]|nr:hypothetical protein [Anaerolineae bacterium]